MKISYYDIVISGPPVQIGTSPSDKKNIPTLQLLENGLHTYL